MDAVQHVAPASRVAPGVSRQPPGAPNWLLQLAHPTSLDGSAFSTRDTLGLTYSAVAEWKSSTQKTLSLKLRSASKLGGDGVLASADTLLSAVTGGCIWRPCCASPDDMAGLGKAAQRVAGRVGKSLQAAGGQRRREEVVGAVRSVYQAGTDLESDSRRVTGSSGAATGAVGGGGHQALSVQRGLRTAERLGPASVAQPAASARRTSRFCRLLRSSVACVTSAKTRGASASATSARRAVTRARRRRRRACVLRRCCLQPNRCAAPQGTAAQCADVTGARCAVRRPPPDSSAPPRRPVQPCGL